MSEHLVENLIPGCSDNRECTVLRFFFSERKQIGILLYSPLLHFMLYKLNSFTVALLLINSPNDC